jgi:hypothetical protein
VVGVVDERPLEVEEAVAGVIVVFVELEVVETVAVVVVVILDVEVTVVVTTVEVVLQAQVEGSPLLVVVVAWFRLLLLFAHSLFPSAATGAYN